MVDTAPSVHGTPEPHHAAGIKGFMTNETAGMPNWVWLLVIAGGIGLAIAVKHFTSSKSGNATTTGTTPDSGLGLAIDPTTGLPYAVSGLVPSGGNVGDVGPPPPPPPPTPTPTPIPPQPTPTPTPPPKPPPTPIPPQPTPKYVTVLKWPDALSTLWGISQKYGLTLTRIEQLNPQITNPNLIYPGEQVRIA